jgi:hypothetical protein
MGRLVIWVFSWLGHFVMGCNVMGHFVMGRFVMGRFVCESRYLLQDSKDLQPKISFGKTNSNFYLALGLHLKRFFTTRKKSHNLKKNIEDNYYCSSPKTQKITDHLKFV